MEKLNVAIADDNEKMVEVLGQIIEEDKDLELVGKAHNGEEICNIIKEKEPDVVVLDMIMPKMDELTVMEQCSHDQTVKKQPAFIVISAVGQERITEDAFNLGASYYMLKPFDKQVLLSRIKHIRRGNERKTREPVLKKQSVREEPAPYGTRNLETDVTNIIHEIGVPAHIKGYPYLREAVKMSIDDISIVNKITKELYPGIAEKFDTTSSKVERAIRHAIDVAWNRGRIQNMNEVFGIDIYKANDRPTNGEFIALIADRLRMRNSA